MMQKIKKFKLLISLALLLGSGALLNAALTVWMARDMLMQQSVTRTLPAWSDELAAALRADMRSAQQQADRLSTDAALRELMNDDDVDDQRLLSHLKSVRSTERGVNRFVVSERSQHYVDDQGSIRPLNGERQFDSWYVRLRQSSAPAGAVLVPEPGSDGAPQIVVAHRLQDAGQQFAGVAGVAMPAANLFAGISHRADELSAAIYFADADGRIVYSDPKSNRFGNLHQQEGMSAVVATLLSDHAGNHGAIYQRGSQKLPVNAQWIPEIGWFLLVEENPSSINQAVWPLVWVNGAVGAGVMLVALVLAWFAVTELQRRMRNLAARDSMTGLMNRQSFTSSFQQTALEMQRLKLPLSFILFDIDYLKKINESHGHATGDRIIMEIARLSRRSVRGSDLVCRWGGEQFALLLPRCELEQAYKIAEQLRLNVQNHAFPFEQGEGSVTISLGVAEWTENETIDQLFGRVDEAVFHAKSEGRNRAEIAYFVED